MSNAPLAFSLDGLLRIRNTNKAGTRAVVEIRSHLYPGDWTYCVWRNLPTNEAWDLFHHQTVHHTDPKAYTKPIVLPGV